MKKETRKYNLLLLLGLAVVTMAALIIYLFTSVKIDIYLAALLIILHALVIYIILFIRYNVIGIIKSKSDKLNESEEKLVLAQKIAKIGCWEEDLLTGEVICSEELFNILGINKKETTVDKNYLTGILHAKNINAYTDIKEELLKTGEFEFDFSITLENGNEKSLFEKLTLVKENGKPVKIIGVVQDISDRKINEQNVIQSRQYYKSLFEGAKDAIILFYPENEIIIDVNQRACEMYGFSREEFIGMSLTPISKYPEKGKERIVNTLKEKEYYHFISTQYKKDGSELHLDITASVINYFGKEVILSINRDISEQRLTNEKIRLLSLGVEQHPFPIVITNFDGDIEYVNHSFEQLTGYSFEEVKGKNPRILQSGETPQEVYDDLWKTLCEGREWRGEFKNKKKDGTLYWEYAVIFPVVDSNNKTKQYLASKMDITGRKELEEQLSNYRNNLEHLVDERTKKLRESEETFRALSENSNDIIMRFNSKLEHLYVNPAIFTISNIPAPAYIGKTYKQMNLEYNVLKHWQDAVQKVFETKTENRIELNVSDEKWFDCRLYPEFNNEGEVVSVITASRDITPQIKSRQDMLKKEKLLRGIVQASSRLLSLDSFTLRIVNALELIGMAADVDRVYIFENSRDPKTHDLLMSQKYEWAAPGIAPQIDNPYTQNISYKLIGTDEEIKALLEGKHFSRLIKDIPESMWPLFEGQGTQSILVVPVEVGGVFWGFVGFDECGYERIWDESEIAILKIIASDIGGAFTRKFIEDALINTEERFKALFDYAPITYFIVDLKGIFIDVNKSVEKAFGFTKTEISKKKKIQNLIYSKEDRDKFEQVLIKSYEGIASEAVELTMIDKDNTKIFVELNTFPITLAEKKMVLCAVHNISLRKESEAEIRTALSHSQELNEIKSRFVSMVSHEFRTPLSTILSSVEILKLFELRLKEDEKASHFRKITKSIDYLTNLLDDVITINRADSGRVVVKFKQMDIVPLLEQWTADIQASFIETPEIIIKKDVFELKAEIDENLFRQIVSNLLNNAIKYTPANKKITISISRKDENFVLQIADEGIGIPIEAQKELFNPFFRAINTGNVPGSGLGLAVAKRSVEILKGEISYVSNLNAGTVFIVTIPLKRGKV